MQNHNDFTLYRNIFITKVFAIAALAIFALSNTPTKYLHKLFANHSDFVSHTLTNSKVPQLNTSGINCHCESNVVIAPFTAASIVGIKPVVVVITETFVLKSFQFYFFDPISFGLRGPPALV